MKAGYLLGLGLTILLAGCSENKVLNYKGDFKKSSIDEVVKSSSSYVDLTGNVAALRYATMNGDYTSEPLNILLENKEQYPSPIACVLNIAGIASSEIPTKKISDSILYLEASKEQNEKISVKGLYENNHLQIKSFVCHGKEFDFFPSTYTSTNADASTDTKKLSNLEQIGEAGKAVGMH